MIHCGDDFPKYTEQRLKKWNVSLSIHKEMNQSSTRGLLEYRDTTFGRKKPLSSINPSDLLTLFPAKDFKYTTPLISVTEPDLDNTPLLRSESYHYLTSPEDIPNRISTLLALREKSNIPERPLLIWEPLPLSCIPSNLNPCLSAVQSVDIFSPNHLELAALFSIPASEASKKHVIEDLAMKVLTHGVGSDGKGTIVIRAGEHGCFILAGDIQGTWIPPFYSFDSDGKQDRKVIDATGAGNAFLGAFAIGLLKTHDRVLAACYGAVGASFALEQVGMPALEVDEEEGELWNGVHVLTRLEEFLSEKFEALNSKF